MATLMLFFERDRLDSRQQNPACIKKTKAVQSSSQTVLVVRDCSMFQSHFVIELRCHQQAMPLVAESGLLSVADVQTLADGLGPRLKTAARHRFGFRWRSQRVDRRSTAACARPRR